MRGGSPRHERPVSGRTKLATIKPTAMLAMFPNPELASVAEEVEATIERIMTEGAR